MAGQAVNAVLHTYHPPSLGAHMGPCQAWSMGKKDSAHCSPGISVILQTQQILLEVCQQLQRCIQTHAGGQALKTLTLPTRL